MQNLRRLEYYLAIERNEALHNASAWVKLENITLSERSKSQKTTRPMILYI